MVDFYKVSHVMNFFIFEDQFTLSELNIKIKIEFFLSF